MLFPASRWPIELLQLENALTKDPKVCQKHAGDGACDGSVAAEEREHERPLAREEPPRADEQRDAKARVAARAEAESLWREVEDVVHGREAARDHRHTRNTRM
eukprot:1083597-Prymnesium_polylepis.1